MCLHTYPRKEHYMRQREIAKYKRCMGIGTYNEHGDRNRSAHKCTKTRYLWLSNNIQTYRDEYIRTQVCRSYRDTVYYTHIWKRERRREMCICTKYICICMYITCRPLAPSPLYPYPPLLSPFPPLHIPQDTEQPGYGHYPLPLIRRSNQKSPFLQYFFRFPVRQRKSRPYK